MPSRETRDLGAVTVSRSVGLLLVLAAIVLIISVPIVQQCVDWNQIVTGQSPGRRWPQCFDVFMALPWPSERELQDYEAELENRAVVREWLLPPTQSLLSRWGMGNERVAHGTDGWLFFADDIHYVTAPGFLDLNTIRRHSENRRADPIAAITDFHRQLHQRGLTLILMPVPVKPVIYPEHFAPNYPHAGEAAENPSYDQFLERLEQLGVLVCDLTPAFMAARRQQADPLYLARDTHWSPRGVELAVQELVRLIDARQLSLPLRNSLSLATVPVPLQGRGDLTSMLDPNDRSRGQSVTVQRVTADGRNLALAETADILILGDSFTNIYSQADLGWGESAGLAEQLAVALQQPIDLISRNGDGAWATRQQLRTNLLRDRPGQLDGKRLVIWQFAVRELVSGDWKPIELPAPRDRTATPQDPVVQPPAVRPAGTRIRGRIEQLAGVPTPGSVPYRDAITAVHLTEVETLSGDPRSTSEGGESVVFVWGLRDNRLTAAARWKRGQVIELEVQPWSTVADDLGRHARMELDDPELRLIDLPTMWCSDATPR